MHCYYGDESFTYAYHNIIFVNIINNCFSFGFMESVKNCFGSKMRMTKQDRYKSNDAEMQKKYKKVMEQVILWWRISRQALLSTDWSWNRWNLWNRLETIFTVLVDSKTFIPKDPNISRCIKCWCLVNILCEIGIFSERVAWTKRVAKQKTVGLLVLRLISSRVGLWQWQVTVYTYKPLCSWLLPGARLSPWNKTHET